MPRRRGIWVEREAGSNHSHAHDLARPMSITKSDNVSLLPLLADCLMLQIMRRRMICLPPP